MIFGKKKLVLDISPNVVKAAVFYNTSKSCKMLDYSVVLVSQAGSVSAAISVAMDNLVGKFKKVHVAIGGREVFMQQLTLPHLPEDRWNEQLLGEAETSVPYELSSVNINYIHLNSINSVKNEFLLIATPKQLISQVQQDCLDAGLECLSIEPSIIALANSFEYNYGILKGQNIILLEIREDRTSFVSLLDGKIYFIKTIDFGLSFYDKALSEKLNLSIQEAESLRKNFCLNKEVPEGTKEVVESMHGNLQSELVSIISFIREVLLKEVPTNLFLTGAGVALPKLSQSISNTIPCEVINVFLNMQYDEQAIEKLQVEEVNLIGAVLAGLGSNL